MSYVRYSLAAFFALLFLAPALPAQEIIRSSSGISFRAAFWNMGNRSDFLTYRRDGDHEKVEVGGAGVWLTFFSRTSDNWVFQLNLGAFGKVNSHESFVTNQDDVTTVVPILLGMQRDFLNINNSSALRPYFSFGGGPYLVTNVRDTQAFDSEEVISSFEPGAYGGGGLNFLFSENFALNFDTKYHMVNFNPDHAISGLEVSLGFSLMWGKYQSQ